MPCLLHSSTSVSHWVNVILISQIALSHINTVDFLWLEMCASQICQRVVEKNELIVSILLFFPTIPKFLNIGIIIQEEHTSLVTTPVANLSLRQNNFSTSEFCLKLASTGYEKKKEDQEEKEESEEEERRGKKKRFKLPCTTFFLLFCRNYLVTIKFSKMKFCKFKETFETRHQKDILNLLKF